MSEREQVVRECLPTMMACMSHRGPDDADDYRTRMGDRMLGLGHRRLAIQDLSAAGHQPMFHPQTSDCIIFNGEVYNFHELRRELEALGDSFRGHSDTEVMLHALTRWGAAAIRRFEGMYAFAFFSVREQHLILARDPLGIKPLYVAESGGDLFFASELRAILATGQVPRKLDRRGVAGMLAYGAVQEPCTIVEGVRVFPAGHYQVIGAKGRRPSRFGSGIFLPRGLASLKKTSSRFYARHWNQRCASIWSPTFRLACFCHPGWTAPFSPDWRRD